MNKSIVLLLIFCAFFLGGCSDRVNMHKDYSKMLPGRMNLVGAVSVGLKKQISTRAIDGEYASAGLYKIDAAGNISAVGVYFTTDTEGNRLEHEEYLHVAPRKLFNISKNYMLATYCEYYDKDGDMVKDEFGIDEDGGEYHKHQEIPYQHLLIRKTDGRICCIDNIYGIIFDNYSNDELKCCFVEDSHGVLHTCDGFRFNLDGLLPSFEQEFESLDFHIHNNKKESEWGILDNGVRVRSYGDALRFEWPQSGFQTFHLEDFDPLIKGNYQFALPKDLVVKGLYGSKYTELYLKPKVDENSLHNLSAILSAGPIWIIPLEYEARGKHLRYDEVIAEDVGVDWNAEIEEFIKKNCPSFLIYAPTAGDKPGSVCLGNPIYEIKDVPLEHSSRYRPSLELNDNYSTKGDELFINPSGGIARFNVKSREFKWILSDVHVNFNSNWWDAEKEIGYALIFENQKPIGVKWINFITMESGQILFKINIPDYYKFNWDDGPDENFILTFAGKNPADGLDGEIKVDITTGEIVSNEVFEKDWALIYLISLN